MNTRPITNIFVPSLLKVTPCTIPLARGKSRSGSVSETVAKAKEIGRSEIKEVVLTGVNIGDFGNGTNENFHQLIQELDSVNGISRFRISSIEPDLLNNDIINFVNHSNKFSTFSHSFTKWIRYSSQKDEKEI